MSRVPCLRCQERFLSDELKPCPTCMAPLCHSCRELHRAEQHEKAPERILKTTEAKEVKKPKKHLWSREDDERGSLADA